MIAIFATKEELFYTSLIIKQAYRYKIFSRIPGRNFINADWEKKKEILSFFDERILSKNYLSEKWMRSFWQGPELYHSSPKK